MNEYPIKGPLPKWTINALDREAVVRGYSEAYGQAVASVADSSNKRRHDVSLKAELVHAIMATYENYRFGEMSRDELLKEYDKALSDLSSIEHRKLISTLELTVDLAIYESLPLPKRIMLLAKEAKSNYKNFKGL